MTAMKSNTEGYYIFQLHRIYGSLQSALWYSTQ